MSTFLKAVKNKYLVSDDDIAAEKDLVVTEGQKDVKHWEMVGMDKLKSKTSQLTKLLSVAVGGEMITECGDVEELQKTLPSLMQIEFCGVEMSGGWKIPSEICKALPKVTHLDLSGVNLSSSIPDKDSLKNIKTLILNKTNTSIKDIQQLKQSGCLINLRELYLNTNDLCSLDLDESEVLFPELSILSLIGNELSNWTNVLNTVKVLGPVKELILISNKLPPPTDSEVSLLVSSGLSSLAISDNEISEINWISRLSESSTLNNLKLTYPKIAGVAPNHVRLRIISSIPQLKMLNSSTVSSKEKEEAEKYYIMAAYRELPSGTKHNDDCTDLSKEFIEKYDRYTELVKKWNNPSSVNVGTASASAGSMIVITFRDSMNGKKFHPDVTRTLPLAIKVAQLKAVIKASFQIPIEDQHLVYKSLDDEIPVPVPLDSNLESLHYYSIAGKGLVEVRDTPFE